MPRYYTELEHPPRKKQPTALEVVREQYLAGERDLDGLERGVERLLLWRLEDSCLPLPADWPTSADDPAPPRDPAKATTR